MLAYTLWLLISSHFNAGFPYPFLNKLPWPQVSLSLVQILACEAVQKGGGGGMEWRCLRFLLFP